MRFDTNRTDGGAVALVAGIAIGAAAGVYFGWREWRKRRQPGAPAGSHDDQLETAAVNALRRDDRAGRRAIDVAAIGPGIIELTGTVEEPDEARRAVDIVQSVDGVHTVVNRLTVGTVERQIVQTRRRFESGDPALHETQWYGMRVGMGRRRQSIETEPERPDDRVDRVTRVLEPSPPAGEIETSDSGPATELSSEEAGSAPSGRRRTGPTH